jgi:hypothetical protein
MPGEMPERRCKKMMKLKSKVAFVTVPAVMALAAVSYGSVVGFASANPSPIPPAPAAAEPASAPEKIEPNEPALPGGGYADAANVQADTQQDGIY